MKRRNFVKQSTLFAFSMSALGSISWNGKIFEANSDLLENPDKIFPGQELKIPKLEK